MRTVTTTLLYAPVFPVLLAAALFAGCSGDDGRTDLNTTNSASATSITTEADPAIATTTIEAGDRYDATGKLDPNGNYTMDGSLRPGVILSPTEERNDAIASMTGLRAILMAELEEVRTHLNDGTLDNEHAIADKQRAADLAQGLERLDRTLDAMGIATDATWNDIRTAQLKESSDLRTWWNAHRAEYEETATK